jgi:hypothetical protein
MSAIANRHFNLSLRPAILSSHQGETAMQDDIDWINASSDFGLAKLCQEMSDLARPLERFRKKPAQRVRRTSRVALPRTRLA